MARRGQGLLLQDAAHGHGAQVVEPHTVEGRPLGRQAEQPGPGVALLRLGGDRSQLGETKAETVPDRCRHAVFIEARRQPHRIGKAATEKGLLQAGITALQLGPKTRQGPLDQGPIAP